MTTEIDQKLAIQRLAEADDAYRELRRDVEKIIRAEVQVRVQKVADARDTAAYLAKLAGLGPTRIANDGLHTKNRTTAYEAIERGRVLVEGTELTAMPTAISQEFEWVDATTVRFTPTAETITPTLAALDLPAGDYHADFQVKEGRIVPITPGWSPTGGTNPVVRLVAGEDSSTRDRMLAWVGKVAA